MQELQEKEVYRKRLEELARLTGRLAHEIKNPLSTIKVNLDLVSEELNSVRSSSMDDYEQNQKVIDRALRKITVVRKETDRLKHILNGLARYTEPGKLEFEEVDINEVVCDMVDFYTPKAHNHSVTIHQKLYSEPLICMADGDMLKEVMLNLFVNALQAMENGGHLTVRTERRGDNVIIEVTDTGKGIDPSKLESVFDVYYSTRPGGSGLGLALAKKIIELHKGSITAASQPKKGTTFTITLPAKKQEK